MLLNFHRPKLLKVQYFILFEVFPTIPRIPWEVIWFERFELEKKKKKPYLTI
jgi:hypothetical protein